MVIALASWLPSSAGALACACEHDVLVLLMAADEAEALVPSVQQAVCAFSFAAVTL